jgi:hypothetical protein
MAVAVLTAVGYLALGTTTTALGLMPLAFAGMLNGMGRDRGPASVLDQAILPQTVPAELRTWALAWYNVVVDSGHALGALAAGVPTLLMRTAAMTPVTAHRTTFLACSALTLSALVPLAGLSPRIEVVGDGDATLRFTLPDARTRGVVARLALLFGLDSIGGGFPIGARAHWFSSAYAPGPISPLFFSARVQTRCRTSVPGWPPDRSSTQWWTHPIEPVSLMSQRTDPRYCLALFLAREALGEDADAAVLSWRSVRSERTLRAVTNVRGTPRGRLTVGGGALMQHGSGGAAVHRRHVEDRLRPAEA